MYTFKERLQEAMLARGVKQKDLVENTGISKSMISEYFNGKYEPKADNLYKIATYLNVNEVWLMGYEGLDMEKSESNLGPSDNISRSLPTYKYSMEMAAIKILDAQLRSHSFLEQYVKINDSLLDFNKEGLNEIFKYITYLSNNTSLRSLNEEMKLPSYYDDEGNLQFLTADEILDYNYEISRELSEDEKEEMSKQAEEYLKGQL